MNNLNNSEKLIKQNFILVHRGSHPKGCYFILTPIFLSDICSSLKQAGTEPSLNGGGCMAKRLQSWTCSPGLKSRPNRQLDLFSSWDS